MLMIIKKLSKVESSDFCVEPIEYEIYFSPKQILDGGCDEKCEHTRVVECYE